MTPLTGIIKFWEETRIQLTIGHLMMTLQQKFKEETADKWHICHYYTGEEKDWEVVESVGGRIGKVIWMVLLINTREEKYGKIFRPKV